MSEAPETVAPVIPAPPAAPEIPPAAAIETAPDEAAPELNDYLVIGGEKMPVEQRLNARKRGLLARIFNQLQREQFAIIPELKLWELEYRSANEVVLSEELIEAEEGAAEVARLYDVTPEKIRANGGQFKISIPPTEAELEEYRQSLLLDNAEDVLWEAIALLVTPKEAFKGLSSAECKDLIRRVASELPNEADAEEADAAFAYFEPYAEKTLKPKRSAPGKGA